MPRERALYIPRWFISVALGRGNSKHEVMITEPDAMAETSRGLKCHPPSDRMTGLTEGSSGERVEPQCKRLQLWLNAPIRAECRQRVMIISIA